jgi:1-deoxy-D-xylulose-5-phosphate synthase
MTLPDRFIDHAAPAVQLAEAGLDARAIVKTALAALSVAESTTGAVREVSGVWRSGA